MVDTIINANAASFYALMVGPQRRKVLTKPAPFLKLKSNVRIQSHAAQQSILWASLMLLKHYPTEKRRSGGVPRCVGAYEAGDFHRSTNLIFDQSILVLGSIVGIELESVCNVAIEKTRR